MAEMPKPTAELVVTIESNYSESTELARLPVALGMEFKTAKDGTVSISFDPSALISSALDEMEKFVQEMRAERAADLATQDRA